MPATEPAPAEPPPEELSQASINAWVGLQIEQAFERITALEKAMGAITHANESPPPPPPELIENALLQEVEQRDRLSDEERSILTDELMTQMMHLQRRVIRLSQAMRRVRGG